MAVDDVLCEVSMVVYLIHWIHTQVATSPLDASSSDAEQSIVVIHTSFVQNDLSE